jgi:hypothetical protein
MKRLTLALLLFFVLAFPATAQDATDEPTPEVTPVVIESEPVVIPDDSTVVVIEAPEPEPAPSIDLGLAAAIAGIVLLGFFTLFGATVVKLGNSAPPWMVAALVGGLDAVKPAVNKWVEVTPTTLDDATIVEVWKEIDKLKTQVGANTANIKDQERKQGGL